MIFLGLEVVPALRALHVVGFALRYGLFPLRLGTTGLEQLGLFQSKELFFVATWLVGHPITPSVSAENAGAVNSATRVRRRGRDHCIRVPETTYDRVDDLATFEQHDIEGPAGLLAAVTKVEKRPVAHGSLGHRRSPRRHDLVRRHARAHRARVGGEPGFLADLIRAGPDRCYGHRVGFWLYGLGHGLDHGLGLGFGSRSRRRGDRGLRLGRVVRTTSQNGKLSQPRVRTPAAATTAKERHFILSILRKVASRRRSSARLF